MPRAGQRSRQARPALAFAATLLVVGLAACAADQASSGESVASSAPVVVTFEVAGGGRFRALLTEPADIAAARALLAGEDVPSIPNGRIVRETGVNSGWSWSLDPADIGFADATIEGCDGLPSDVEAGTVSGGRYCPWSATVVAIEPAP
jgi:hypothetical protein